jgi:hypothetical protein
MVVCIGLSGCDSIDAHRNVQTQFPDSEVVSIPDSSYTFLVKKQDGEILWVKNQGITKTPSGSTIIKLFKSDK